MTERVAALLVVPHGTHRPEPVAVALRELHPQWHVAAVWCGDPQLRPPLNGVGWIDVAIDELDIVAGDVAVGEWKQAAKATGQLVAAGVERVVVSWVGSAAVLSSIDALAADQPEPITLVPRATGALPADGLAPSEAELIADGIYSSTVVSFGSGAADCLAWIGTNLDGAANVGQVLQRAAQLFGAAVCADEGIGVGRWRWDVAEPALLDVAGYDSRSPWTLDPEADGPMRIELLGMPARRATVDRAASQLAGARTPLCLPGGLEVDAIIRQVVADATGPVPSPWSDAAAFRDWLAPRYWRALRGKRPDLLAAFPEPDGRSAGDFRLWCRAAFTVDDTPFLLSAPQPVQASVIVAPDLRADGLNLVGYFESELGLGDVVRRLRAACVAGGLSQSAIATHRTDSPGVDAGTVENRVAFTTSLCVVTADQFPYLAADFPELFAVTERMIGYWFWELEHIPLAMRQSFRFVDEVWAGSRFVTDAFAAVAPVPVRHVPIPVVEPQPSRRGRGDFEALAGIGDRPIFLTALDHLSVTERKNPVGVIEAFRRAFGDDEGPVLVVKTMNGRRRWPNHQRVLAAADGRGDVRVWDEALDRADQMALVAAADCVVSLHRSEGLGLHLAEAMWLRTPTIATRYSGNLDFMDDDNSLLVDADLVNVENGERVYPPIAQWAAPDLDQAAEAMRRIVGDAALAKRLASAGRQTMQRQPGLAETGKLIRQLVLGEG